MTLEPLNLSADCIHSKIEIRRFLQSNGIWIAVQQCPYCGRKLGSVKKSSVQDFESLPVFDQKLLDEKTKEREQQWDARRQARLQEYEEQRQQEYAQWQQKWREHLESDYWKKIRQKVFRRANFICEGCGVNRATQVHHLTYDRLGCEMMFDLVAICKPCHKVIHPQHQHE